MVEVVSGKDGDSEGGYDDYCCNAGGTRTPSVPEHVPDT